MSRGPFAEFNPGAHVGDDTGAVAENRRRLMTQFAPGTVIQWLRQEHGIRVSEARGKADELVADACWSRTPGVACAVLTADCLPVLLSSRQGDLVAAVHAGWRGLQAGVLEAAVDALPCDPSELLAWLGPGIGPASFEVGAEVREAFLQVAGTCLAETGGCFTSSHTAPGKYFADLYALARIRLRHCGVGAVYGGGFCTYRDADRFFSYRRDGRTGRMATVIAPAEG